MNLVGHYRGYPVYRVTEAEYGKLSNEEKMNRQVCYCIEEGQRMVTRGLDFGTLKLDNTVEHQSTKEWRPRKKRIVTQQKKIVE